LPLFGKLQIRLQFFKIVLLESKNKEKWEVYFRGIKDFMESCHDNKTDTLLP